MILSVLEEVLSAGIQAPSADNLQPWRFVLVMKTGDSQQELDHVDLFLERKSADDFAASGLLTLYISAGAVIENIRVACFRHGLKLDARFLPMQEDPFCAASLYFSAMPLQKHTHEAMIYKRVTNRKFYRSSQTVDPKVYADLAHFASDHGLRLTRLKRGEERYKKLELLLSRADQLRYEVERLHREFFKTIRFGKADSADGLPIKSLEAGPGSSFLFRVMSSWKRMRIMNALGFSRMMGVYTAMQMRSSDAALLLTASSMLPLEFIRGGEMTQRLWHEMTFQGLAAQPMEALPIFILNLDLNRCADFSAQQRDQLMHLRKEFYEVFHLPESSAVVMLWRVGYAEPVSARTLRRPIRSFILDK